MKVQLILVILLASSLCYKKSRKVHHRKSLLDEDSEVAQEELTNQDFRRLRSKLINDTRINNPKKEGEENPKPFRTEFVKTADDMASYVESKKNDPVQLAYDSAPEGNDQHSDSYQGNFYVIRQGVEKVNGVKESAQEMSVYVNDFALYYTKLRAENRPNGYRDVLGSVNFQNQLVHEGEQQKITE